MATIVLKGTQKTIECTLSQCDQVNKMKESGVDPKTPLNIAGTVIELGEIRYALKDSEFDKQMKSDDRKTENDNYYAEAVSDYNKYIEKRCRMSPQEKAKDVRMFDTLFFGVTEKKLNEKQVAYVQKEQLAYFEQNKNHPYANINFYKLLKDLPENKDDFNMKYHVASATLRIVSRLIEESFMTAKQLKLMV